MNKSVAKWRTKRKIAHGRRKAIRRNESEANKRDGWNWQAGKQASRIPWKFRD